MVPIHVVHNKIADSHGLPHLPHIPHPRVRALAKAALNSAKYHALEILPTKQQIVKKPAQATHKMRRFIVVACNKTWHYVIKQGMGF